MIENLINKFINLSKKKIIWRKNEKTKILLFDNNHAKLHFENLFSVTNAIADDIHSA